MMARLMELLGGHALRRRDLLVIYIALFLSFLGTSIAFPLRMLYARSQGASPLELGLMAAAFLAAPLLTQLPLGWLVDRWGRVPVLLSGVAAHTVISLCYILFSTPVDLIVLRFIEGVTIAAIQPAIRAYIADVTPEEHRSEAYGVLSAALNAGLFIGPLLGGVLAEKVDFQAAYIASVIVEAIAAVIIWRQVHEPAGAIRARENGAAKEKVHWRAYVSLPLLGAYAAFACVQSVMGMMGALWSIWMNDLGASYTYIGLTYTVFALPQIVLGAYAGRLGDRFGLAPLILIPGLLVSVIYAGYGFVANLGLIMVMGLLEGAIFVFQQPAAQSLLADASPPTARGRVQGLGGMAGALGGTIASFASIPLYHISVVLPWVLAGVIMAIGSIAAAAGAFVFARRQRAAPPPRPALHSEPAAAAR